MSASLSLRMSRSYVVNPAFIQICVAFTNLLRLHLATSTSAEGFLEHPSGSTCCEFFF
ncbi:hypothetical protein PIB30_071760 [Stylosanthes scabra]|uniref:Uncharacterized protein n=1 Tax=Stylosanthes scabra TaxID=79078 RepID=A0ABU6UMP5_9FABA|nr:hypothetical protein [Stylosanthes scabra]